MTRTMWMALIDHPGLVAVAGAVAVLLYAVRKGYTVALGPKTAPAAKAAKPKATAADKAAVTPAPDWEAS